jgi:hypothetical protein
MSASHVYRPGHHTLIGAGVLRVLAPFLRSQPDEAEDPLHRELQRIVNAAPHLLTDIGFERDPAASSPAETIWVGGALRVAVATRDRSVSVLQR